MYKTLCRSVESVISSKQPNIFEFQGGVELGNNKNNWSQLWNIISKFNLWLPNSTYVDKDQEFLTYHTEITW
jgi:hypothetical protein